jgi:protein-disulfide isomerase
MAFLGDDSLEALRYVQGAGLQNLLWQMQEALYRNQGDENSGWVTEELARDLAEDIDGLDADQMIEDSVGQEVATRIDQAQAQATAAGVGGTPTFFIQIGDQEPYPLEITALDPSGFRPALDDALNG